MRFFPVRETLQDEFKSDLRKLPLRTLLEAVICMANGPGGTIYLGVEDNGRISGLHPSHKNLQRMQSLICHYTEPHIYVQVYPLVVDYLVIACIKVPLSPVPIATKEGVYKKRQLQNGNGEPQCITFTPEQPCDTATFLDNRRPTLLQQSTNIGLSPAASAHSRHNTK